MGLGAIGPGMLILIILAALLLFGPKKLPELGRAFGRTLSEFRKGTKDLIADEPDVKTEQKSEDVQRSEDHLAGSDQRRLPE